ncbi:mannitol dehydrogenase putative [Coemansia reversa NRRL 1564]|uniref:Mannitol dehydrogenase putative n=1 Tax=Coemansia reversa (strain ATCC 12441 / NRRL 1564) TaxID=763665 RepID=A0A2G5BGI5_COERN|nr:mannitol dehydrogenase putative [Coemansia reversa NRRL 1564]|eukprot:PIA18111.1 mannitol dehydrogenase putative [Coemansia reversa NRRL 1564]
MVQGKFDVIHGWAAKKPGIKVEPWSYKPRPIGPHDVEIEIIHTGICGSDLHTIKEEWKGVSYPVIVGHEIVGRVVTKGDNVTKLAEGDIVGVGAQVYGCLQDECSECSRGLDPLCPEVVLTYNNKYADGEQAQGGYASAIRLDANYAFKIPDAIANGHLEYAAPLMCAGVTTFTPMIRNNIKKGDKVGIVGVGGLGHLAIQFAHAFGAEVYAFSHSPNKKQQCLDLGATHFINTSNEEDLKSVHRKLEYLFVTSTVDPKEYSNYMSWMINRGKIVCLAASAGKMSFSPKEFIFSEIVLTGSATGGADIFDKMLEFAAKHNIRPIIERFPIEKVNDALERVDSGKVRYRAILDHPVNGS